MNHISKLNPKQLMTRPYIISSKIYIQWNNSPELELCEYEMNGDLTQEWDKWLDEIENERSAQNE